MKKTILEPTKRRMVNLFFMIAGLFFLQANINATCNLNANFGYTVGANGVVNFASTSTGTTNATTYQWQFYPGSGTGSGITHTFSSNGTYPVSLYTFESFCFDSVTVYVTVTTSTCNLQANFSYTVGSNGLVNFSSTSTGTNAATSFFWYFQSATASGATASYAFPNSGVYPVSLLVTNGNCVDSNIIYISVPTGSCNLAASFNYTVGANGVVNFESTSTGTTSAANYQWYFSPGSGTGAAITHTYSNSGTYAVQLHLYDGYCQDTATVYITVNTATCNLFAGYTYTLGANNTVTLASTSSGTTSSTTYQWYFYPGTSSGITTTYTFASAGNYPVTLWANNGSCTDSVTGYISIANNCTLNLNAGFTYTVGANGIVNFLSTSTGTTSNTNYQWHFSPGSGTGAAITHTYNNNGTYLVQLFITDGVCLDSAHAFVTVNTATCNLYVGYTYTLGANGSVTLASTSSGTNSGTTYQWLFYPGTSSGATTTHTFASNGNYPVTLIVNNGVCVDSITGYVPINFGCFLNANFTYTIMPNGAVNFSSTTTGASSMANYYWNFGDTHVGTGATTTHTYSFPGSYVVSLHVYDTLCNDSVGITVNISIITGLKNNGNVISAVTIYPNPANGEFMLDVSTNEADQQKLSITIYNTLGQIVFNEDTHFNDGRINKNINLRQLESGIYFIKTDYGSAAKTTRLIIQK